MKIGGNKQLEIQVKTEKEQNTIGEDTIDWVTAKTLTGWLDLLEGSVSYKTFNTKIQESSHVYVCDYEPLLHNGERITPESSRAVVDSMYYDVKLIDNPMGMNHQLEIYLNYVGGQNVSTV